MLFIWQLKRVRYSLIDPKKFIDVNLIGYINLLDALIKNKPKKIFYASSSSVYGDNDKFPLKETEKLNPKNIYGVSKKLNETISKYYSKKYDIKMIGMRFLQFMENREDRYVFFKVIQVCIYQGDFQSKQ